MTPELPPSLLFVVFLLCLLAMKPSVAILAQTVRRTADAGTMSEATGKGRPAKQGATREVPVHPHQEALPLIIAKFYSATFRYEHREKNGWIRYEMLTLVSFAGTFVKSTGVEFCTQRGQRSGLHGAWRPSPSGLIVAFNWKGNAGTDIQREFTRVVEGVYRLIQPNSDIVVIKLTGVRTTIFENTWALDDVVGEWQLV